MNTFHCWTTMKTKIQAVYPQSVFQTTSAKSVYIVDLGRITENERNVEVYENLPIASDGKELNCFKLNNSIGIKIDLNVFDDHQFKDENNDDVKHCECCFYPSINCEDSFIAFLEIKDCRARIIKQYKKEAKEQIKSTVQLFKNAGIINSQKIYGIISFPRRNKTAFNEYIYRDNHELTRWVKDYGIHLIASNEIYIKDNRTISDHF